MRRKAFLFIPAIALAALSDDAFGQQLLGNHDIDEVVVRATKAADGTPMAISNVAADELEKSNFGQDVPYLISSTPSVIVTSDAGTGIGYTSLRVRGTGDNRINITVNGVPLNDSESQSVFWVNMPDFASSLEQVQIQRGVGTSTNGAGAFGATIGLQTQRPGMSPHFEIKTAGGSFDTFKATLRGDTGLLSDHFVFDGRYSLIRSGGYIDRAKADVSSYYASGTFYGGATMVRLLAFGSDECTNQAWNYVPSDSIAAGNRTYNSCGEYYADGRLNYYDQTDNYRQQHYHLSGTHTLGADAGISLTLHYTHGKGYYEDYKTNRKLSEYALDCAFDSRGDTVRRSDLVRRKWMDNDFYGGVLNFTYSAGRLDLAAGLSANNYDGDHFGRVIWVRNIADLRPDHEYYRNNGSKLDFNVFAKTTYALSEHWDGYVDLQYRGIRYKIDGDDDALKNMHIDRSFDFFNPKAGLTWHSGRHTAYASFATGHREPTRNNYTESADEHPTFETLLDYEAGYSCNTDRWNTSVSLYYMDYRDQLVQTGRISEIGEALTSNVDDSYRIGIEVSAGVRIAGWLRWDGNVALSRNRIRNFTESVAAYDASYNDLAPIEVHYSGTDIAFSPAVCANSTFAAAAGGFEARLSTACVGRQYLDNSSCRSRSIDPYCVSNLIVGYSFRPSFISEIGLSCRITNIFDAEYETSGWVASYVVEGRSTVDNRTVEDGLAAQAGTAAMVSLTLKF